MPAGLFDVGKDFVTRFEIRNRNCFTVGADEPNGLRVLHYEADLLTFGLGLDENHRAFFDFISTENSGLSFALKIYEQNFITGL